VLALCEVRHTATDFLDRSYI